MNDRLFSKNALKIYIQGNVNLQSELINQSLAGGQNITIKGYGFDLNKLNNKVFICGLSCDVVEVGWDKIQCKAPPLLSQSIIKNYPLQLNSFQIIDKKYMILSTTFGQLNNQLINKLFDNYQSSCINQELIQSQLIIEFKRYLALEIHKISVILQDENNEGSVYGTTLQYQLIGQDTWNNINFYYMTTGENIFQPQSSIQNIQKLRFYDQQRMRHNICEIKIIGRLTQNLQNNYDQDTICDAQVIVNDFQFPIIENITQYQFTLTPFVESISTKYIPTDYQVNLTIIGIQFGNQYSKITVIIEDVNCIVFQHNETQINCTTGIKYLVENDILEQFKVEIDGNVAINKQIAHYGNLWSDINTWGGFVYSSDGDSVIVKKGQTIIVDMITPKLISIFIEGTLLFADNGKLNSIDAQYLIVHYGNLIIGSKDNPYKSNAKITLRGEYNDTQLIGFGNKVFGCYQCTLQIFGKPKTPVWTLLNKTIQIGDNSLLLDVNVNWNIGDLIVVTSSDFDHKQSETKTIIDIQQENRLLIVDSPFQYQHYSKIEQYEDQYFHNKVEVGVLSRNIQITGDQSKYQENYGDNMKISGDGDTSQKTLIQIEYTEFINGGQTYYQGKHPIYFKQNNDLTGSYLLGNSIYNNNARCIVLYQVSNILIENNICYNTQGNSIFLLSGFEINNTFVENLIINTKSLSFNLQSDEQPAGFYITNPQNTIKGNIVAGSDYYGFQFDFQYNLEYNDMDCRSGLNLTEFSNNSAHSYVYGLNIPKLIPQESPCAQLVWQPGGCDDNFNISGFGFNWQWGNFEGSEWTDFWGWGWGLNCIGISNLPDPVFTRSTRSYISHFRTWLIEQNGIQIYNVGNVMLIDSQVADCKNSIIYVQQTDQSLEGFLINKALIIKQSSNKNFINKSIGLILPRTQQYQIKSLYICNYQSSDTIFVIDSQTNSFTNVNYMLSGIKFINSTANLIDESFTKIIFWDLDGSLLQQKPLYIFPFKHYLQGIDGCELQNSSKWKNIMFCQMDQVEIRDMTFIQTDGPFTIKRSTQQQMYSFDEKIEYDSTDLILATGYTYDLHFPNYIDIYKSEINMVIQNSNYDTNIDKGIIFRFKTYQQIAYSNEKVLFNTAKIKHLSTYYLIGSSQQIQMYFSAARGSPDPAFTEKTCYLGQYQYDENTNIFQSCVKQKTSKLYDQYILLKNFLVVGQVNPLPSQSIQNSTTPTPTPTPTPYPNPNPQPTPTPTPSPEIVIQKMVWSNLEVWESKQLPIQGDIAIIRKGYDITLDIDPPQLKQLIIIGTLIFDDKRDSSILKTNNLWIKGGQLLAGNSTTAYQGKIKIYINSQLQDTDNQQFIIEGLVKLFGVVLSNHHTNLIEFAKKGNDTILVDNSSGWKIGDLIIIGPSGSNYWQSEEFTILDIQQNLIKLSGKLLFNHYGHAEKTLNQNEIGSLDMRAVVGHLTRNIQIGTGVQDSTFKIKLRSNYQNQNQLQFILVGVEISYSKQKSYDQSPLLDLSNSYYGVLIDSCSFHHSSGSFIKAQNASSITIKNSVFYYGQNTLVQLNNIRNLIFSNNLLMNAKQPNALFANIIYQDNTQITSDNIQVSDNVGQGSEDSGFLFMTISCLNSHKIPYLNNYCSSTNHGCFSYRQSDGNCDYIGQAFAYHSQTGILASLQTKQIKVSKLILVENQINLIIKMGTDEIKNNQLQISNSFISAFLRPNCEQCYLNDLLPYCKSSIGIQMPTITTQANPPSISSFTNVDYLTTIEAVDARLYIQWLIFDGFKDKYWENNNCGKNSVFKQHPQAADASPQIYLSNTTCQNCNQAGLLFDLRTPDPSLLGWLGGCGSFQCTGQINILIEDQDGSFFGQIGQAIGNNFYFAPNVTYCTRVDGWVGFFCKGNQITVLNFMNTAPDYNTRLYSPIQLTDGQFFNQVNSFKEWSWIGDQPMNRRESKFTSIIQSNSVIRMNNAGENPTESLYWLSKRKQAGNPLDYAIIQMQFSQQNIIQVTVNNNTIQPGITQSEDHWNLEDKRNDCGANNYFYKNRTIHFVVTGENSCFVKISLKNTIQITSRIALTQNTFLGKDFLQYAVAQLGGDPYNYFILSVRKISKKRNMQTDAAYYDVEWGIVDPAPIGSQEALESKNRLTSIQEKISDMKSSTSSPYQLVSSQVNITTIDQLNFESSEKTFPQTQGNQNIFISDLTQASSTTDYVIYNFTQNPSNEQNNSNNSLNINSNPNKSESTVSNNGDNNNEKAKIIILSVLMPILFILFILFGIAIYQRYKNIRKYKVAPSIQSDNDIKCKVEYDSE